MTNLDQLLMICLIAIIVGFIMITIDVQKRSYEKGVRDGYHRGRSLRDGRPDIVTIPSDIKGQE